MYEGVWRMWGTLGVNSTSKTPQKRINFRRTRQVPPPKGFPLVGVLMFYLGMGSQRPRFGDHQIWFCQKNLRFRVNKQIADFFISKNVRLLSETDND